MNEIELTSYKPNSNRRNVYLESRTSTIDICHILLNPKHFYNVVPSQGQQTEREEALVATEAETKAVLQDAHLCRTRGAEEAALFR